MERGLTAYHVAESLDLDTVQERIGKADMKRRGLLVYKIGSGHMLVFSFGSVCFYDCDASLLRTIIGTVERKVKISSDDYTIAIDPQGKDKVDSNGLRTRKLTTDKLLIVAQVMAQSVAIDFYERRVDKILRGFEKVNEELRKTGTIKDGQRLLKMLGMNNRIIQNMIIQNQIFLQFYG